MFYSLLSLLCPASTFDWLVMYYSDPFVVLILALSFIGSIFFLHISAKIIRSLKK